MKIGFFFIPTNHRSNECEWLEMHLFGDVLLWSFETNELVSFTIDSIGRARPDRFLGKNNDGPDEWNAHWRHGTPIFLPLHSSRDSTYLSAPLFDEDPGNNGNERRRRYLLPPIFRMVENRFARARGIGVRKKKRERRKGKEREKAKGRRGQKGSCGAKEGGRERDREKCCERAASVWSFINRRRRSDYLFSVGSL